ncbi:hypothetical protein B0J11DRAFT_504978 [Dendryphion nanum]|uniref:Uncharacterized protein n=1 Tax=Dendryphion nanum TaxID=256645 RepID=A0A9P9IRI4_9PLEO|nr:hypothetical protein B0J11DRAFT_504978 [Dendryphion nanum]
MVPNMDYTPRQVGHYGSVCRVINNGSPNKQPSQVQHQKSNQPMESIPFIHPLRFRKYDGSRLNAHDEYTEDENRNEPQYWYGNSRNPNQTCHTDFVRQKPVQAGSYNPSRNENQNIAETINNQTQLEYSNYGDTKNSVGTSTVHVPRPYYDYVTKDWLQVDPEPQQSPQQSIFHRNDSENWDKIQQATPGPHESLSQSPQNNPQSPQPEPAEPEHQAHDDSTTPLQPDETDIFQELAKVKSAAEKAIRKSSQFEIFRPGFILDLCDLYLNASRLEHLYEEHSLIMYQEVVVQYKDEKLRFKRDVKTVLTIRACMEEHMGKEPRELNK